MKDSKLKIDNYYFCKAFGIVQYKGASTWKFLGLKHMNKPAMSNERAKNSTFLMSGSRVNPLGTDIDEKVLEVLYGTN